MRLKFSASLLAAALGAGLIAAGASDADAARKGRKSPVVRRSAKARGVYSSQPSQYARASAKRRAYTSGTYYRNGRPYLGHSSPGRQAAREDCYEPQTRDDYIDQTGHRVWERAMDGRPGRYDPGEAARREAFRRSIYGQAMDRPPAWWTGTREEWYRR